MTQSTVVVTGSAGRIGAKVVRRLLEEGRTVIGFDLKSTSLAHARYREVIGTFDDRAAAEQANSGAEAVLHLAFMSWLPADTDKLHRANVEGTRVVLKAAARSGVGRFVFASSGEVYPENVPDYLPVDEAHPLKPRSPYGFTKLLGEELVRFFGRTAGFETVILRFSHTQDATELLDPQSYFSGPRFFLKPKIRQQDAFGNTAVVATLKRFDDGREALVLSRNEQGRPFRMHITETRDMVEGILLALDREKAAGEAFNLGSTEPFDFADAVPRMAEATGLPLHVIDLPGTGVYYHTSNRKIRDKLGFQPKWTIDSMIADAVRARTTKRAS